jgi:glutathione-independent formaldehyde dehydrogenase
MLVLRMVLPAAAVVCLYSTNAISIRTHWRDLHLTITFAKPQWVLVLAQNFSLTMRQMEGKMKALVYEGPRKVAVKEMPDARIEKPTDVLVKITTTNICGSDLHMYEGRTNMETGRILGHENLGMVIEVGNAVDRIKVGDRVCLPFNIGCGFCKNCEEGLTGYCLTTNPDKSVAGAAYGFAGMGPYSGGQAEYLRVPYGDFNCLLLPPGSEELENDYVMLSDIFPTGYHATELAGVRPGETVVIYGAGPVGLMAAHSAAIKGASQVMVVDTHKDRLALAEKAGAIPIDDSDGTCVDQILQLTKGQGADRGCECVGYQCCDHHRREVPNLTMNNLVKTVKATGGIGVVGVFIAEDPGAADALAKKGEIAFDFGQLWMKGQKIATGQANVKAYNRRLRDLITTRKASPSFIISHELPLEQAPEGYKNFDERKDGWTKVILKP